MLGIRLKIYIFFSWFSFFYPCLKIMVRYTPTFPCIYYKGTHIQKLFNLFHGIKVNSSYEIDAKM